MIIDMEDYKMQPHCAMLRMWKAYIKLCIPVPQKPAKIYKFVHDISGIMSHIDRTTGKLQDHFLPRYARGQHAERNT